MSDVSTWVEKLTRFVPFVQSSDGLEQDCYIIHALGHSGRKGDSETNNQLVGMDISEKVDLRSGGILSAADRDDSSS